MFGLPIWAVQLVISVLKATGAINWAEAVSLRAIASTAKTLENLKTYHEASDFPSGRNNPWGKS
jgi:hypothetical protein